MTKRNNQQWLNHLRGLQGVETQTEAYTDLFKYLYTVMYNYLLSRQTTLISLQPFPSHQLADLAQDFVQQTLEKLAKNNHALLNQFNGEGTFTGWIVTVAKNEAGQELRKRPWTQPPLPLPTTNEDPIHNQLNAFNLSATLEEIIISKDLAQALKDCIKHLPEKWHTPFHQFMVVNRNATDIAKDLNTTRTTIYQRIHKAKQQLKRCLQKNL